LELNLNKELIEDGITEILFRLHWELE